MEEPSFWWRVEGTSELLSPDSDCEDSHGFEVYWELVADNVTERHHATALAERYLNNDGFTAVRIVSVWIEERSQPGEVLRLKLPASLTRNT